MNITSAVEKVSVVTPCPDDGNATSIINEINDFHNIPFILLSA